MKPIELLRMKEQQIEDNDSGYKTIICLASSRKHGGYCIVGKEIKYARVGNWVRPIKHNGPLQYEDIVYENESPPSILDIIKIPILHPEPKDYQKENVVINTNERWVKNGRYDNLNLKKICDPVETIWINGYSTGHGNNDKIPYEIAKTNVQSSAILIMVTDMAIRVKSEYNKMTVRANFNYNGIKYDLAITDKEIEDIYKNKGPGDYAQKDRKSYLCISLALPYERDNHAYKLVAGMIIC